MAVQHLTGSLRALGEAPAKGQTRRVVDLEERLVRAVERDLAGLPTPDGYPLSVAAGGGGPRIRVSDEYGRPDVVAVTSVEASAIARAEPDVEDRRRTRDRHHELCVRAVRGVEDAVVGIQVAFAALASIDDLTKSSAPAPRTCDRCTGKRGKGGNRPIHVRGTVGDRLERALALCAACYGFVVQTAPAGSRAGWLPSDEQIAHHEQHGRWRIRVVGRTSRRVS